MTNMTNKNYFTLILGAILAISPYFLPIIPADWKPVATAFVTFLAAVYHLYQENPSTKTENKHEVDKTPSNSNVFGN